MSSVHCLTDPRNRDQKASFPLWQVLPCIPSSFSYLCKVIPILAYDLRIPQSYILSTETFGYCGNSNLDIVHPDLWGQEQGGCLEVPSWSIRVWELLALGKIQVKEEWLPGRCQEHTLFQGHVHDKKGGLGKGCFLTGGKRRNRGPVGSGSRREGKELLELQVN